MLIIWINIWDSQSSSKAKYLINRRFNVRSFITTIQDANMNPDIPQCKIVGNEVTRQVSVESRVLNVLSVTVSIRLFTTMNLHCVARLMTRLTHLG